MTLQFRWRSSSKDNFPFKRSKVQRACHLCRQKKMRCDGKKPCDRCQSLAQECIYDDKPSPQRQKQPKRHVQKVQQELLNSDNSSQSSKNEKDAEATEEQQSRRRQSSPKSQPQSAVTREDENRIYCRRNLKRISFSNTIYESMRQQNHNKSYLYATQLPPLLLDFFNLTAQPHGIWSRFTASFRDFRFHPTAQSALELNQQTLALFAAHNLLYSSLFDFSGLTAALEIGGSYPFTTPDATSAPVTVESLLIYAIFALVLHAAYQSLSTKVPKLSDDLMDYANTFYREAHRRFIALTFPATSSSSTSCCSPSSSPTASNKTMLFSLAQAAVLLTHYQCAAVCEGQAHMTLQMGVAFAQRCALFADISATGNVDIKRRKALATILNSWRAWFAFYLHLEDWPSNDIWPEEPIEPRFCPTTEDSREAYQLWAMDATSAYSHFLLRLSTTKMRIPEVRKWLDMLQAWSAPSPCDPPGSDSHVPPKTSETSSLPASILLLFHQVLTIQVYLCQTTAFSDVFQSISTVGDDSDGQKTQVDSLALDLCDIAASEIVHAVDNLTVNNHAPVVSEVEPFRRRPQQPITLAVLYPLSLATSTTVACLRRRVSDREDAETSSKAAAPPAIPAFKLQRLLNPVCSQMEAANVIYGPLHEIMAAAKHSTNTRTMLTMTENQRAMRGPAADNHRSGNSTRSNMSDPLHWYDSFPEDGFFNEARITPMAHPTLDVMSRNVMREKIDQEQLEKLSHNKNAVSSSSNLDLFAARAGLDAYGMPLMSLTHSNSTTTRARAASASSHPKGQNMLTMMPGQKRQYFPPGLDLVQQQQVPQDSSAMAVKRMRTETSCSDNNESLMRSQEMLRARDNGLNIPDMSDPAALQVYSENYLFMFENPITATSTTAVAAATDQNQFLLPHKDRSETFISSIIGNSTASGGMVGSLSIVPPKLPLPTPKQRNVNTKSWTATSASGQKDWNVDFQESIVETLHHQNTHAINVDSSNFASGIVDTSMMMSPSTANGQPGIAVSDNNDMMYFLCGNSNSSTSTSISSNEARTSHQSSPATTGQWNEPARTSYKSPRSSGGTKSSHKKRHQSRKSSWTPSFPTSAVPITTRNPAAAAPAPAPFEQDPWLQTAAKMSSTDGIVWEE